MPTFKSAEEVKAYVREFGLPAPRVRSIKSKRTQLTRFYADCDNMPRQSADGLAAALEGSNVSVFHKGCVC